MRYVILHNIRSVHNVGSIFRTADGAGVDKIFCTGYTPTPTDRFGRKRKDFAKVALGAEESMPWEAREEIDVLMDELHADGVRIIAAEKTPESTDYRDIPAGDQTALVFGNEVEGVPEAVLKKADQVAAIPMRGEKRSLNVSVAAGILIYHFSGD